MFSWISKYTGIAESTQASGIAGLLGTLAAMWLGSQGIIVAPSQATLAIVALMSVVNHIVPDGIVTVAKNLDVDARKLAASLPALKIESSPDDYPDSKNKYR